MSADTFITCAFLIAAITAVLLLARVLGCSDTIAELRQNLVDAHRQIRILTDDREQHRHVGQMTDLIDAVTPTGIPEDPAAAWVADMRERWALDLPTSED